MLRALPLLAILLVVSGCAVRRPAATYRLVRQGSGLVLIPPGVDRPDLSRRSFRAVIAPGRNTCPPAGGIQLRRSGKNVRVTVAPATLAKQPGAWLTRWASDAEQQGCIAPGSGADLAFRIVESVPLDPAVAWRLTNRNDIRAGYVDLGSGSRLQVDSPILLPGASPDSVLSTATVTGGSNASIDVEVKSSPGLIGFERAWYALRPRPHGAGYSIEPLSAERHIEGKVETRPAPAANHFQFGPDAAFYRLLYRADRTIVVIGAASPADLDRLTHEIDKDIHGCGDHCAVIPNNVGVNPEIVVTVNGRELALPPGSTVAQAIRFAGGRADDVLPHLSVSRAYAGRQERVEFDPKTNDILALRLNGGEVLAW